ncbi:hypothetical protein H5410_006886 [Solanum commersonii]|uniref:Uncharacterized protein n=1 Tax=Solanum commersonii TaxID=4109 RepID=A0A9J6ABH4_SOLCO|nr:hypothetical protein H5410_006886 [Solanum commersonii]
MRIRFSTITDKLILLEEPVPLCRQVSKILEISPRSWTNGFATGNKTREPKEIKSVCTGLIYKGEDMRADLTGDADQKGDAKRDKSLASKVSQSEISKIDGTMKKKITTVPQALVTYVTSVINQVTPLETSL